MATLTDKDRVIFSRALSESRRCFVCYDLTNDSQDSPFRVECAKLNNTNEW